MPVAASSETTGSARARAIATVYNQGETPAECYARAADVFTYSLPRKIQAEFDEPLVLNHVRASSNRLNGYLRKRYSLPLTAWGQDLVQAVCDIAAYSLLRQRGFSPESFDRHPVMARDDAFKWAADVRDYLLDPDIVEGASPSYTPEIISDPSRGWDPYTAAPGSPIDTVSRGWTP